MDVQSIFGSIWPRGKVSIGTGGAKLSLILRKRALIGFNLHPLNRLFPIIPCA